VHVPTADFLYTLNAPNATTMATPSDAASDKTSHINCK